MTTWFRGESNRNWQLAPGALRKRADDRYLYDEYQMLREMRLLQPIDATQHPTIVDWLVMCQHYGLPTRLLDWSESILAALYFAAQNDESDGAVHALQAVQLNSFARMDGRGVVTTPDHAESALRALQAIVTSVDELLDVLRNEYHGREYGRYIDTNGGEQQLRAALTLPIALYPPRNNQRIARQSGMFTLHGGAIPSLNHTADFGRAVSLSEMQRQSGDLLVSYVVPANAKETIRQDLGRLGIHHASLFPEFESQARHLCTKWPGWPSR